jgi:cobalt/nickel transport system permease protein
MIGLKSLSVVSIALYLFYSSPFNEVLGAISRLRVPKVVVFMLMIAHRYFFLFQKTARELLYARSLRLYERSHLRKLPSALNVLIHKSLDHGEEVYIAMRLRGGESALPLLSSFQATRRDYYISGAVIVLAIIPLIII